MPSYLDMQVEEAFKKAKGNLTKARTILIQMAAEDQRLLMALAKPYLTAIAAQSLNHYTSQRKTKKPSSSSETPPLPKGAKNQEGFGLDLLKALSGQNVPKFGQEAAAPPVRKKAASSEHVNALKLMAAKSKSRTK